MKGRQIKDMLQNMRLVLWDAKRPRDCDFHISQRGVPYVHITLYGKTYKFIYFGKTQIFRVFDENQNKRDFLKRNDVIEFFQAIKRNEIENAL